MQHEIIGGGHLKNILDSTNSSLAIFGEKLIVGNHDTITLWGNKYQSTLKDYVRVISNMLLSNNEALESKINEVIESINKFEKCILKRNGKSLLIYNQKKKINAEYKRIVSYIEQVSMFFQLQQAQLLQETKLIEKILCSLDNSVLEMENCISTGEKLLSEKIAYMQKDYECKKVIQEDSDIELWFDRLARRIEDLQISKTVAIQTSAQLRILLKNNRILLDNITSTVLNTFPIWQNQIIIWLGTECFENKWQNQEIIRNKNKMYSCSEEVDIDRIIDLSKKMKQILEETVSLEKKDSVIRENIQTKLLSN